jgi:hypothetical protein
MWAASTQSARAELPEAPPLLAEEDWPCRRGEQAGGDFTGFDQEWRAVGNIDCTFVIVREPKRNASARGAHHIRPLWNAAAKSLDGPEAQSEEKPFQPLGITASEIVRSVCRRMEAGAFALYTSVHKSGGATAGLQACPHRNVHDAIVALLLTDQTSNSTSETSHKHLQILVLEN